MTYVVGKIEELSKKTSTDMNPFGGPLKLISKNILKKTGIKSGSISNRSTENYKRNLSEIHYATKTPLEKDIQKAILNYLEATHIFAWRNNTGAGFNTNPNGKKYFIRFSTKGAPDILGCLREGRLLAIEVKRPGGVASKDQEEFLGAITKLGGLAFVATSIDDVKRVFKANGY